MEFCWQTNYVSVQFSSVHSLSHVRLFATPWIGARQASLSITNSRSSLRLTSIESVMPSSLLILGRPLLLLPSIPPSIRVFSNESNLHMRCPKYWSFHFNIIPSKEIPGLVCICQSQSPSLSFLPFNPLPCNCKFSFYICNSVYIVDKFICNFFFLDST